MINQITVGHCLEVLKRIPDNSVHCCVTSPPYYGLRDYGLAPALWPEVSFAPMPGLPPLYAPEQVCCLGLEKDIWSYVGHLVLVFREVWRVLRDDGTLWLNLGDSYAANGESGLHIKGDTSTLVGSANKAHLSNKKIVPPGLKPKDLMGIPFRVALALQADGWYLRSDVIWHKPNPMPESVTDRPTKAHEYVFLLSKGERYYYDAEAIKESTDPYRVKQPDGWDTGEGGHGSFHRNGREKGITLDETRTGRNRRTVWTVATQPYAAAHFATFPPKLIEPMILAGCPENGIVLDPFGGSGTTGKVALANRRNFILIDANPTYAEELAPERLNGTQIKLV